MLRVITGALVLTSALVAQTAKEVRSLAKKGSAAIPQLSEYLKSPDVNVRYEAVKSIAEIGGPNSIDPLVQATRDNDADIQIRSTEGLVNFYLPGYLRTGVGSSIRRVGSSIKSRFTDTNDQVIDSYVKVRPDVVQAIGRIVRGGASLEARANAARAAGILRGKAATPDLVEALRSKDSSLLYESLIALQKIHDFSVGPKVQFLLRDLDDRVQIAAIETAGMLQNKAAAGDLAAVLKNGRNIKIKRAALGAIAMLQDAKSRPLFTQYLADRDDRLRAAAAEGFARLQIPADRPILERAYAGEGKTQPRLSLAFALVMDGKTELSEFSPLKYLINSLNSVAYRGDAFSFLVEAARIPEVRYALYQPMERGTKDEKVYLARVLAQSGDRSTVMHLEKISRDEDTQVAEEGLRALRTLKARL